MMIEKYLKPGDKVEIQFKQRVAINADTAEQKRKIYISKINQVLEEDKIEVLMPIEQSKLVLLPRNAVGNLVIYTSNGLFQCDVKVGERYKSDNIYLQVLVLMSGIKKYQRREYYRYSCNIPVYCRSLTKDEKETLVWDDTIIGREGETLDIGGGGVRFIIDEEFKPEDMVVCCIPLEIRNGTKEVQGAGKVLSVKPVKDSTKFFEIRVQFERMSNVSREQIIQFIFEDERKRRKKSNGL